MVGTMGRRQVLAGALGVAGALGIGVGARRVGSVAQEGTPGVIPVASPGATPAASPLASPATSAAATITIEGYDIGWRYNGQQTAPGAPIDVPVAPGAVISLPNVGAAAHNFVVDQPPLLVDMPVGQTVQVTLPADLAPGTYRFYCNIPGHEPAGMVGNLIVG